MVFYHVGHWKQDLDWIKRTNDNFNTPRGKYYATAALAALVPPVGKFIAVLDAKRQMDATLALYGLGYEDIAYTSSTLGFQAMQQFTGSTYNYVSSNVNRLYKK